jgi:DNA-binding NtrC family response regulator
VLGRIEPELIKRCLEKTGGNKRQAARLLHLSRTTLIDKLNRLSQPKKPPADDVADEPAKVTSTSAA